jgi:hypothetical protein
MFNRSNATKTGTPDLDVARIRATVDSESRPYTDPAATYPRARQYQAQRGTGTDQRQAR